jgi:hypothetical protein
MTVTLYCTSRRLRLELLGGSKVNKSSNIQMHSPNGNNQWLQSEHFNRGTLSVNASEVSTGFAQNFPTL